MTSKRKKLAGLVLSVLMLLGLSGFVWLKSASYRPSPAAEAVLSQPKAGYTLVDEARFIQFVPKTANGYQFVFYNGALVPAESYTPLAEALVEQGYRVYLLKTPLNLPVLAGQEALKVIADQDLDQVILAGHSLGGVIASQNAQELGTSLAGLVLLASYPAESTDLSSLSVPVLSITASKDQVINWDKYNQAKKLLPTSSHYVTIEGGNHAGFGDYGAQKGDGTSSISHSQQRQEIVAAIEEVYGQ